jgi:hypothetical protein
VKLIGADVVGNKAGIPMRLGAVLYGATPIILEGESRSAFDKHYKLPSSSTLAIFDVNIRFS